MVFSTEMDVTKKEEKSASWINLMNDNIPWEQQNNEFGSDGHIFCPPF